MPTLSTLCITGKLDSIENQSYTIPYILQTAMVLRTVTQCRLSAYSLFFLEGGGVVKDVLDLTVTLKLQSIWRLFRAKRFPRKGFYDFQI